MRYTYDDENKLKYIMIYSVLFDETDRIREYASEDGNVYLPPELFNCLYSKSLRMLPLLPGATIERFCNFFDNNAYEILNGNALGLPLKELRALVDLSKCNNIPHDTPDRANVSILQSRVSKFIEEDFYLIMSILLYCKAQNYREHFENIKPGF
jgi:hypothetical protein